MVPPNGPPKRNGDDADSRPPFYKQKKDGPFKWMKRRRAFLFSRLMVYLFPVRSPSPPPPPPPPRAGAALDGLVPFVSCPRLAVAPRFFPVVRTVTRGFPPPKAKAFPFSFPKIKERRSLFDKNKGKPITFFLSLEGDVRLLLEEKRAPFPLQKKEAAGPPFSTGKKLPFSPPFLNGSLVQSDDPFFKRILSRERGGFPFRGGARGFLPDYFPRRPPPSHGT